MQNKPTPEDAPKAAILKAAKESSRYAFIAQHRGGPISKEHHRQFMKWARECSEHVLSLIDQEIDKRLVDALQVAKEWENDTMLTREAMKASLAAHAVARESSNPVLIAVARSIGQAVATAHMADHSIGAALYALKAVKQAGESTQAERAWQENQLHQLPAELIKLVQTTLAVKEKSFKME
jgi:hypothetical protein